jgi:hypothetical protein
MTQSHSVRACCLAAIIGGIVWTATFTLNFPLKDRGPNLLPDDVLATLVNLSLIAFESGLAGVAWTHRRKLGTSGRLAVIVVGLALAGALVGSVIELKSGALVSRREGPAWYLELGSLYLLLPFGFALLAVATLKNDLLPRWAAITPAAVAALFALLWIAALTGGFWATWILFALATLSLGPAWIVLACGAWSTTRLGREPRSR